MAFLPHNKLLKIFIALIRQFNKLHTNLHLHSSTNTLKCTFVHQFICITSSPLVGTSVIDESHFPKGLSKRHVAFFISVLLSSYKVQSLLAPRSMYSRQQNFSRTFTSSYFQSLKRLLPGNWTLVCKNFHTQEFLFQVSYMMRDVGDLHQLISEWLRQIKLISTLTTKRLW